MSKARGRSKKRFQKTGKRYTEKDRRVPKKKEYGTLARTKSQRSKGGGKYSWGDAYDDYIYEEEDYEVDEQEAEMAEAFDEFAIGTKIFYEDLNRYKKFVRSVLLDFFEHGDAGDVMQALVERDDLRFNYEFVKRAISMSLDRRNREREMVSQLLAVLHGEGKLLRSEDIADGFLGVFEQMESLKLDCPHAPRHVSIFLARAITDECLPPRFLDRGAFIEAGGSVVQEARVLLSMKHGTSRMERVWGSSAFAVNDLKKDIKDLVREFIISGDMAEAAQCIRDLDSRNFHHEVVKRAVELSMDYDAKKQQSVAQLLQTLYTEEIVHPTQFVIGFKRLFEGLPALRCDVPAADTILNGFVTHGRRTGYLPATYEPPKYLEAHSSGEEDGDNEDNINYPHGFTAEMAEQMQEFQVISPRTQQNIVDSIGIPGDVIQAARDAGIESDDTSDADDGSYSDLEEGDTNDAIGREMDDITDYIATQGRDLLQSGLN